MQNTMGRGDGEIAAWGKMKRGEKGDRKKKRGNVIKMRLLSQNLF